MEFFFGGLRGKLVTVISALVLLTLSYYAWFAAKNSVALSPQIIFVAALGLLFLVAMPVSIYYQSKKVFESDKLLQEEQVFYFREDGFSVSAAYGNSDMAWDKAYKIKVTKDFVSIYLSKIRAFVIPARFLKEGEIAALNALLKDKVRGK